MDNQKSWLLDILKDGPKRVRDIQEANNTRIGSVSWRSVQRERSKLGLGIYFDGRDYFWMAPGQSMSDSVSSLSPGPKEETMTVKSKPEMSYPEGSLGDFKQRLRGHREYLISLGDSDWEGRLDLIAVKLLIDWEAQQDNDRNSKRRNKFTTDVTEDDASLAVKQVIAEKKAEQDAVIAAILSDTTKLTD